MPITFDGDMNIRITLDGEFGNLQYFSDYFQYAGSTTVTPSMSEQVLHTNGLIMPTDVTVKPIPDTYGEVTQTGTTVTVNTPNEYPGTTRVVLNSDSFYDNSDATLNNSNLMAQGVVGYGVNGQRYVGSIPEKTASDIVVSGNEITTPAGHYPTDVQTTIPAGQVSAPVATKGSVSNVHTIAVTPSVSYSEGYIDTGSQVGEAVIVSASELVSGSQTITENDTYDVTNLAEVVVEVPNHGELQTKSVTYTPTTSQQTDTILPDTGYDGMDEVNVTVNAIQLQTGNTTFTPSTSQQIRTVIPSTGYDGFDKVNITVNAVPFAQTESPTITQSAVTNHSVTLTPSIHLNNGYVEAGTMTGDPTVISASDLVSGTKTITGSGTEDVTNYAAVHVPSADAAGTITTDYRLTDDGLKWVVTASIYAEDGGWIPQGHQGLAADYTFNAIPSGTVITPSTAAQTVGVANTMLQGAVTVNAVPSAATDIGLARSFITEDGQRKCDFYSYVQEVMGNDGFLPLTGYQRIEGRHAKYPAIPSGTNIVPTETAQAFGGAGYVLEDAVTVIPISSGYVGSSVPRRDDDDMTGVYDQDDYFIVTAPAGYYPSSAEYFITNGNTIGYGFTDGTIPRAGIAKVGSAVLGG